MIIRIFLLLTLSLATACYSQEVSKESNVCYGEAGSEKLLLDIFRPVIKTEQKLPAVILVHGGGWAVGDKQDFHDLGMGLARMGYVAFSINYRLATEATNHWPAQLDDTQRAVRWIRAHAEQYGIDPQHLGAFGASAGGHLVTFLGTIETRDNSDASLAAYSSRVQCVVDLFGPVDLTEEDFPGKVKLGATAADIVRRFLGGTAATLPDIARSASPLFLVDAKTVPFLIFHGRKDDLVPLNQSERLNAALLKAGIESKLMIFEQEGHGFVLKEDIDSMAMTTAGFLKTHLNP